MTIPARLLRRPRVLLVVVASAALLVSVIALAAWLLFRLPEPRLKASVSPRDGGTIAVGYLPDGRLVTIGQNAVSYWSGNAPTRFGGFPLGTGGALDAAISPDGARVATTGLTGGGVSLWDMATGQSIGTLRVGDHSPYHLRFSPDGLAGWCDK